MEKSKDDSKLKKSFLLTISIFVICSLFAFNSQAIAQTPPLPDPPTGLTATIYTHMMLKETEFIVL
ncbi:MAG TPA: hypothetical protein VEU72_01085 [Nitrosopumilaceae archaeon]|nr:hypothetical protein [Nitrosopumilaceae archaeon]